MESVAPGASQSAASLASWLPTFGGQPGLNQQVRAFAEYDDGNGSALYVGGIFTVAGGLAAERVARWDGTSWSALSSGLDGTVYALCEYDDGGGGGPALYAGGDFATAGGGAAANIAKWDGTSWSPLGSGVSGDVYALAVYDDGSGTGLYATGQFTTAGGAPANYVARWDGTSWSSLGSGANTQCYALCVYDDGGGDALYLGGFLTMAGGVAAGRIAKWDGTNWSSLGAGVGTGGFNRALALTVYDDGGGADLYVGGDFTTAGGGAVKNVASWDGSTWSDVSGGANATVLALTVHDDGSGSGPELYAGGSFSAAQMSAASRIAKWDGANWSALGSGMFSAYASYHVHALTEYDDGSGAGPTLFAGGWFDTAGGLGVNDLAGWDGASWSAVGDGVSDAVHALAEYDDGSGAALYAGGDFATAGGALVSGIAKWNGSAWSPLGSGFSGTIRALEVYDDGGGPELYVGGLFTTAGGLPASNIAKWDGATWSALGSGVNSTVFALAVFDDGGGPELCVGGGFTFAGSGPASRIAKWDGVAWSGLDTGVNDKVYALATHDDGTGGGTALYAGGALWMASGGTVNRIAKWDGTSWSGLGTGSNHDVHALAEHDDGGGMALYVGGEFTVMDGTVTAGRIARWDGTNWSALGAGTGMDDAVRSLASHDDGGGSALFAGGEFATADGAAASRVARWDGASWSELESGLDDDVLALETHDAGGAGGVELYAGGDFSFSPSGDSFLARWGSLGSFTSYCTAGTSGSGCQALLSATGTPSATAASGFDLIAAGVEGDKDGLYFFGSNGRQANSWGNGTSYQCVVPPVARGGLLNAVGTLGACNGFFSQDLNALWCPSCPKPQKNPGAGAVVQAQLWYRDPFSSSNQTTSLSDALELLVGP